MGRIQRRAQRLFVFALSRQRHCEAYLSGWGHYIWREPNLGLGTSYCCLLVHKSDRTPWR